MEDIFDFDYFFHLSFVQFTDFVSFSSRESPSIRTVTI